MSKSHRLPSRMVAPSPRASGVAARGKSIARSAAQEPRRSLARQKKDDAKASEIRIGTSGWHYRSWIGPFYPPKLGSRDLLSFYSQHFDTTEINNSFYRLPTEKAVREWHDATPEDFLFAWKASRFITHMKRLKDVEESIQLIFTRMAALGHKMGPVLFQLPPALEFNPDTRERLALCLKKIPKGKRCAVEFRHPSWYADQVFDLLRDHDAALCLSDHAAAPAPWIATAEFAYVRAHGASGPYEGRYGREALKGWLADLETWRGERRDVFVYFDNDFKSAAPADARELLELMTSPRSAA